MNPCTVTPNSANVLTIRFTDVSAGWEQWLLLTADRHHDNIHCDRDAERRHLVKAAEREAMIFDFGDLFCAMQGKYDPRSSMDDIRPEDVGADYLDRIVKHAAEFYGPYAKNWLVFGRGNHETSVTNKHGVDLTSALVHRINSDYGCSAHTGGYGGWVRFVFSINNTRGGSLNMKYHHGSGGGGPVTRGVIQTNRQAVYLPDADIVVNGHTHDSWVVPIARERLSIRGVVSRDISYYIRTPGYKDEYSDGAGGYHIEKWGPPKPIGCVWVHLVYNGGKKAVDIHPYTDVD